MNVNAVPMTAIQVQVKRVPSVLRRDLAACAQENMLLPENGHAGSVLTSFMMPDQTRAACRFMYDVDYYHHAICLPP